MHGPARLSSRQFGDAGGFGDVEERTIGHVDRQTRRTRGAAFGDACDFGDAGGFDYAVPRRGPQRAAR
jgi:hypothetical protein